MKQTIIAAMAVLLFAAAAPASAGTAGIDLPEYTKHTLENGLTVFVMETREVPLVSIRLLLPAGSAADPAGFEGAANLTAELVMKGAGGMGADEIAEQIEGLGGELSASADRDYTAVAGNFLARDLAAALEILGTVVASPDFPADEVERQKEIVTAAIHSVKDSPYRFASREFARLLAAGHPYGHPVEGSAADVEKLTRADVAAFHAANWVPEGAFLAIVGDIDAKTALKLAKKRLGSWRGERAAAAVPVLERRTFPGTRVVVIDDPELTQSQIRIGNIAVGMDSPDYFALAVGNNTLGGGFTSRLMDEIRVNRGLSYGARSGLAQYRRGGTFTVVTYTKNETLREAIDVALEQVRLMRDETLTGEELASSQRYLSGLFPFRIETNDHLAGWLTRLAFYGLGEDFVETYRERIGAVTAADVQRVARENFHAEDCLIVLLANYAETKDQLAGLGGIEVIAKADIE
ncbi:MAG: insulinase family protein [Candidatus Krumholzibacteriota bacterium]|nr:insulinase family protein [Candidatus Krumholzibacteriota bacterium]